MNIFVLDLDPIKAAEYHCDKHVCKMTVETMQMLLNPFIIQRKSVPFGPCGGGKYKIAHVNHPCSKWVMESFHNYMWTLELGLALGHEYNRRYQKVHACFPVIKWLAFNRERVEFPKYKMTEFALAMPDEYKTDDVVESYRRYYVADKLTFARWNYSQVPDWWPKNEISTILAA
jgi:hypothetical protein